MRIVHFTDWHGKSFELPAADLYVCTGDMLPNFRIYVFGEGEDEVRWECNIDLLSESPGPRPKGNYVKLPPMPDRETTLQKRYLARMGTGYMRDKFGNPNATVICCRGNHDFTDLVPMFGGEVFEITRDPTRIFVHKFGGEKLTIGGVRGVKYHRGRWSDELRREQFSDDAHRLPNDLDILVTHAPPEGILDRTMQGELVGSPALRTYVSRHNPDTRPLKAHLFGHIHEMRGMHIAGGTIFSNASQGWHIIDL